jgi:hypothetical protein
MSFYFPCISGDIERREYKEKVDDKLKDISGDLERLIFWEDRYNQEMRYGERISDYTYLKNVIDMLLSK